MLSVALAIHNLALLSTSSQLTSFRIQNSSPTPADLVVRVPLDLGVMSRCPDALLCESLFDEILESVSGKVDLSLIYVARYFALCICQSWALIVV